MLRVPQHHPGRKRRGRGCCAISGRASPSPALRLLATSHTLARRSFSGGGPLATALVSPIIPVQPRNPPLNPFFPLLTQKKGGGGLKIVPNQMRFTPDPVHHSIPGGSNRLENSAPICRLSTEHPTRMLILSEPGESKDHSSSDSATLNCKPAFLTPAFTTTSIAIVGAPTIVPLLTAKGKPKKKRALAAASGPYNGERNPRAQALRGSPRRSGQAG